MSTQELEPELDRIIKSQSWGEERIRNLGATVESLMQRRGYSPAEFDELAQDDSELVA